MRIGRKQLTIVIIASLFLFSGFYAYERLRGVTEGVKIKVFGLESGTSITTPRLNIYGIAKHATRLSINNLPIQIDQKGNFSESLLLSPGYTIITVEAQDKFGKKDKKTYEVVFHDQVL